MTHLARPPVAGSRTVRAAAMLLTACLAAVSSPATGLEVAAPGATPESGRGLPPRAATTPFPAATLLPPLRPAGPMPSAPPIDLERAATAPFEANAELRALGEEIARRHVRAAGRVEALLDLLFDENEGLGFTYQWRPSRTAIEAFEHRAGNCISMVNLFVALARSAGLEAGFVEVLDHEAFYREEGTIVRSTHVVGGVEVDGQVATIDFFPRQAKTYRLTAPIPDARAAAHFYNSIAVEAMLAGEPGLAETRFELALAIDPDHAETWNNRAMLALRQDEAERAVDYLERALAADPELLSPMENLEALYRRLGRSRRADRMAERAERLRTRNPYYLLAKGLEAIRAGDLARARSVLKRARSADEAVPEVHLALGRVALLAGHPRRAESAFRRASRASAAYSRSFQGRIQSKIDGLLEGHGASTARLAPSG